jgi:hypothetical protein
MGVSLEYALAEAALGKEIRSAFRPGSGVAGGDAWGWTGGAPVAADCGRATPACKGGADTAVAAECGASRRRERSKGE